jgi:hypothetical protein
VPERPGTVFREPEYYEMYNKRYAEARKALPPPSAFKDDPDKNAYFKALLSKMREIEAAVPKELDLVPSWDQSNWSDERKALRANLDGAADIDALQDAAQKLLPDTVVVLSQKRWNATDGILPNWQRDPAPALTLTEDCLEQVRGVIRAMDDFQSRYPGVLVQRLTVRPDDDHTFAATWRMSMTSYNQGSSKINVNSKWLNATADAVAPMGPQTFDEAFAESVATGFHYRRDGGKGGDPEGPSSYAVMMHELGHGLNNHHSVVQVVQDPSLPGYVPPARRPGPADSAADHVDAALADYYVKRHIGEKQWKAQGESWNVAQLGEFNKWRRDNMSGYSFTGSGSATNGGEAIAEAFADVEINGVYARETSKVLHRLTVDYYNGDTPYASKTAGFLGADPDTMDWPDFRTKGTEPPPIQYWEHRNNGTQPPGMTVALTGGDAVKAASSAVADTRVTIPYLRNNTGMRGVAGFGQDSEPWGRYMSPADVDAPLPAKGWERGTATLNRPLYVDHNGGEWKSRLSAQYGGATGEELSAKLRADGYDGVITRDDKGIVEFVDVRTRGQRRFKVDESTSTWQEQGLPPLRNVEWTDEQYAKVDDKRLTAKQRAEVRRIVDSRYKDLAENVEPGISATVFQTMVDAGATPHGLEYRLKDPPSLYRKVQDEMVEKGIGADAALDAMRDTVRFTAVVPAEGYWKSGNDIRDRLIAMGAVPKKQPAGIAFEGYRGRNMTFELNGLEFELQIHTEKSMSVKDVCHKLYEEERLPSTPEARKVELREQQQRLWDTIPITKGTPVIRKQKDTEVWFKATTTRHRGPTVPIIHEADGSVHLPYGSVAGGSVHPPIDMMTSNVVSDDMAAWQRLTPEEKEWGILWYKRLRWFLAEDSLGTVYEGDIRRAAAIYAALSPRTDFDVNYAAVRQVLAMDPKDVARLVARPKPGDPIPTDEFGPRPFLNGVIPDNLERVKRLLAVDDDGKWVVSDPVWALRGKDADDLFYPQPAQNRVRMYHRTSLESADSIRVDRRFLSREQGDVFLSDRLDGAALGYGNGVVVVDVPRARWQPKKQEWTPGIDDDGVFHGIAGRVDDEFPGGEKHFALQTGDIDPSWIVQPRAIPEARKHNEAMARLRERYEARVYEAVKSNGGITIDLAGDSPVDGYAFAPSKGTETRIPKAVFKPEDVDHFIDAHWDQLNRPGCHLGLWVEGDNVFLDVSKVGKSSAATIKAAQDVDQLAVYDLKTLDVVPIGEELADGTYSPTGKASDLHNRHRREVERDAESRSATGADEVPAGARGDGADADADAPGQQLEELFLMLQRGPKDQAALEAGKIYNHALNVLDEEDAWAVTVDTWDARIKLGVRNDLGEARRVLDGVMGKGVPNANQDEKNQIYQEFAEATRRALPIIRELDPASRELARANGYEDLLAKHIQAGTWGASRQSSF